MARKIEIQRAQFKSLKEAGKVIGTFANWIKEQSQEVKVEQSTALIVHPSFPILPPMHNPIFTQSPCKALIIHPLFPLPSISDVIKNIDDAINTIDGTFAFTKEQQINLNKMQKARLIFDYEQNNATNEDRKMVRNTVIKMFKTLIGISDACSSTYYQNIKREKGLIQ